MNRKVMLAVAAASGVLLLAGCGSKAKPIDEAAAAPPPAQVIEAGSEDIIKVDHAERFALVAATEHEDLPELHVNGSVAPDIDKSLPVTSLASGRAVALYAKLGDDVQKGKLLLKVQSNDISNAFQTYEQAKADEQLAKTQLERANLLYDKGAIALNDKQVAEDVEAKAAVAVRVAQELLRTLGADPDHPDPIVNVYAPISGTIVEQNIVQSASVHTPDNQPNLFTIANLSTVWVLCDVYENDLSFVRLGDRADIQLFALPNQTFHGRISNISRMLDPTTRSAKVRIEVANPGPVRVGMFATATFFALHGKNYPVVPSSAVLHLHDKDWVFVPQGNSQFRRLAVTGGKMLGDMQIITAGLATGQQVVKDALALNTEGNQ
jgi:cobalt-zinc-cadmium efflux system membrane fusion protein